MQEFVWALQTITLNDVLDIGIVTVLLFGASLFFRGTQAVALLRGVVFLLVALFIMASVLQLQALGWLITTGATSLSFAVLVIFQPELRQAFERLGRGGLFITRQTPDQVREYVIDELVTAADKLSERRHGALVVLQRNSSLQAYVQTGSQLNSDFSADILLTIFWPKTELHDGAVIIGTNGRILSASSVLPLTSSRNLPNPNMGTRHRAAMGISEVSDAICIVVSEETGKIGVTQNGRMISNLEPDRLRTVLGAFYGPTREQNKGLFARIREFFTTLATDNPIRQEQS